MSSGLPCRHFSQVLFSRYRQEQSLCESNVASGVRHLSIIAYVNLCRQGLGYAIFQCTFSRATHDRMYTMHHQPVREMVALRFGLMCGVKGAVRTWWGTVVASARKVSVLYIVSWHQKATVGPIDGSVFGAVLVVCWLCAQSYYMRKRCNG